MGTCWFAGGGGGGLAPFTYFDTQRKRYTSNIIFTRCFYSAPRTGLNMQKSNSTYVLYERYIRLTC